MRALLVAAALIALVGCTGHDDPASAPPPSRSAATVTPSSPPRSSPPPLRIGQGKLRAWLAKEPHSVEELTGRKVPRGVVLCGADVLGHGPEDIHRLFPADVVHAIRFRDVHPIPTLGQLLDLARNSFGGSKCDPGRLAAEQPGQGGPAAGTYYMPVLVTNEGSRLRSARGRSRPVGRFPTRTRFGLDVTGDGPVVLMPSGHTLRTYAYLPTQPCSGAPRGPRIALALSDDSATQPQVEVAGPGVPPDYGSCPGAGFMTSAGRRAAPSR